jgi:hypothetical protein
MKPDIHTWFVDIRQSKIMAKHQVDGSKKLFHSWFRYVQPRLVEDATKCGRLLMNNYVLLVLMVLCRNDKSNETWGIQYSITVHNVFT